MTSILPDEVPAAPVPSTLGLCCGIPAMSPAVISLDSGRKLLAGGGGTIGSLDGILEAGFTTRMLSDALPFLLVMFSSMRSQQVQRAPSVMLLDRFGW